MTAQQFRAGLAKLEMDQGQIAQVLGIGIRTAHRYANGGDIPQPIAALLNLLFAGRITVEDIQRAGRPPLADHRCPNGSRRSPAYVLEQFGERGRRKTVR